MKFPSVKTLTDNAWAVIRRFPLSVAFTLIGTIAAILNTGVINPDAEISNWYWRVIKMADLGLLLTLSAALYCESNTLAVGKANLLKGVAAAVAVLLLFALSPTKREDDTIRFLLLGLGFHLLVAFAGFIGKETINGFWQFNKTLFLRFLSGVLYSGVLYVGLAAAIAALNFLFGFKFEWRTFLVLWIVIAGLFNTFFVLAGLPTDLNTLNGDNSYPKSLKIFTQYVLIPLITVYLLILLAYEVKIAVDWSLPKGRVSSLVLAYAVFGILSLLLIYPIRNQEENKWIKSFSKSFYFFMLPLLALLYLAVGTRVFKYGITEERYFLIVLAFWLLCISVYFLISKKQNIKLIPISLCVVVLLSVYGPQSAFNISYASQKHILKKIFERNHAFKNGLLLPINERKFSHEDAEQAISAFRYVITGNELTALQPYFNPDLQKVTDSLNRISAVEGRYYKTNQQLEWVKKHLSLEHFDRRGKYLGNDYENEGVSGQSLIFSISEEDFLDVKGYNYIIDINSNNGDTLKYTMGITPVRVYTASRDNCFLEIGSKSLKFNLRPKLDSIAKLDLKKYASPNNSTEYVLPKTLMQLNNVIDGYKVKMILKRINIVKESGTGKNKIIYLNGTYLIK